MYPYRSLHLPPDQGPPWHEAFSVLASWIFLSLEECNVVSSQKQINNFILITDKYAYMFAQFNWPLSLESSVADAEYVCLADFLREGHATEPPVWEWQTSQLKSLSKHHTPCVIVLLDPSSPYTYACFVCHFTFLLVKIHLGTKLFQSWLLGSCLCTYVIMVSYSCVC